MISYQLNHLSLLLKPFNNRKSLKLSIYLIMTYSLTLSPKRLRASRLQLGLKTYLDQYHMISINSLLTWYSQPWKTHPPNTQMIPLESLLRSSRRLKMPLTRPSLPMMMAALRSSKMPTPCLPSMRSVIEDRTQMYSQIAKTTAFHLKRLRTKRLNLRPTGFKV